MASHWKPGSVREAGSDNHNKHRISILVETMKPIPISSTDLVGGEIGEDRLEGDMVSIPCQKDYRESILFAGTPAMQCHIFLMRCPNPLFQQRKPSNGESF